MVTSQRRSKKLHISHNRYFVFSFVRQFVRSPTVRHMVLWTYFNINECVAQMLKPKHILQLSRYQTEN